MTTTTTAAVTTTASSSRDHQPQRQPRQTNNAFLFCSPDETSFYDSLRQNDPQVTDLQLWLNNTSNIGALRNALEENTVIQEVCFLIHESFGQQRRRMTTNSNNDEVGEEAEQQRLHHYHRHHVGVLELFDVLGRLPQLQRLFFNTYRFPFVAE